MLQGNPRLKKNAQRLRRNMTKEERRLWYDYFKLADITVNRQRPIGPYIVDFYCAEASAVVELDGGQHYEREGIISDADRDVYLRSLGLEVLRYSNADVNCAFSGVCEDLTRRLEARCGRKLCFKEP